MTVHLCWATLPPLGVGSFPGPICSLPPCRPTHRHTVGCLRCNGIKDQLLPDVGNNSHIYFVYRERWARVLVCVRMCVSAWFDLVKKHATFAHLSCLHTVHQWQLWKRSAAAPVPTLLTCLSLCFLWDQSATSAIIRLQMWKSYWQHCHMDRQLL